MSIRVLKALPQDLCQADPNELLVPNPLFLEDDDNDFFIGIRSRRPARYGQICESDLTLEALILADHRAVMGDDAPPADPEDEEVEERMGDFRFMCESLAEFNLGSTIGCSYRVEDDELNWDIYEQEANE